MAVRNPSAHAKIAADALARLTAEVRSGRAEWEHPHTMRQSASELARLAGELATALEQLTAATARTPGRARQVGALHLAGEAAALTADRMVQAHRALH